MQKIYKGELDCTYTEIENPIYKSANDPWVIRHGNDYYYCWSGGGINVKKIPNLDKIENTGGSKVWAPPAQGPYSKELWAPELHYINSEWYIYFAADDGANANHRMYVLKGTSQDPTDRFEFVGKITDPSDKWAIDGTVMQYKGELFFIWSGWEGNVDGSQQLYIAHMSSPTAIDSQRVMISKGEKPWEKVGMPLNEGPVALTDDEKGTAIIVYSASGSWTDSYCLGQLILSGDDPMDASAWKKNSLPILKSAKNTYGPGHCSFTTAYDGSLWVIYHANSVSGTGWQGRQCRVQKVEWDGVTLKIGKAVVPGEKMLLPSLNYKLIDRSYI